MSEQQNLDAVRNIYAAFGRADLDGILALLDPEVSWRTPGSPGLPTGGLRRGVSGVREFFGLLLSTFDIQDFRPADFLSQGDKVVVLGRAVKARREPEGSWIFVGSTSSRFGVGGSWNSRSRQTSVRWWRNSDAASRARKARLSGHAGLSVYSLAMTPMRALGVTLLIASLPLSAQASKMKLEEFLRLTPSTTATGGAARGAFVPGGPGQPQGAVPSRRPPAPRRMQAPLARPPLNISSSARRLRARCPTSTCWASTT